ncbi:hypothetical protein HPB50_022183 [Hyalomma asiaticum]|uniref:Uncharacterized protein n=1 Tax=Hyalomma asiaticum TaxID=266040 RepID=A0ACB7TP78_HYAAI|nr:hypothetical protein HPB50_022183 [Hyalomma asiaticum]
MGLTCSDARCRLHPVSLACCPRRSLVSQASRLTMVGSNSRRADELQGHLPAQQHCCRAAQSSFPVFQQRHLIHGAQALCYRRYLFAAAPLTKVLTTRPPLAAVPCLVLARPCARRLRCGRLQAASSSPTRYEAFDFHHECRRMQWDRLSILMDRISHDQDDFGTGKRTILGAFRDGYNSAVRYIKNNFNDGFRQDAIDLFLGNYRVQEGEGASLSCPLAVSRDRKYWVLPCFLVFALSSCLYCLCFMGAYTKEFFLYFLFSLAIAILTLMAIVYYGTEFVDFPKLRDLTPSRRSE